VEIRERDQRSITEQSIPSTKAKQVLSRASHERRPGSNYERILELAASQRRHPIWWPVTGQQVFDLPKWEPKNSCLAPKDAFLFYFAT
jgi:hypothetical protein